MYTCIIICFLSPSVNIHLVIGQTCSGANLTFSCEAATEAGLLIWTLSVLPGFAGTSGAFGQTLNNAGKRIASPDSGPGPNPSTIIILNATAADNGARVQCGVANGQSSEVITLSIRE